MTVEILSNSREVFDKLEELGELDFHHEYTISFPRPESREETDPNPTRTIVEEIEAINPGYTVFVIDSELHTLTQQEVTEWIASIPSLGRFLINSEKTLIENALIEVFFASVGEEPIKKLFGDRVVGRLQFFASSQN